MHDSYPALGWGAGDVADIIYFSAQGRGRRSPRRQEGGWGRVLLKSQEGGRSSRRGGTEGAGGCLQGILGGRGRGLTIFVVRGRNSRQAGRPNG